MDLKVRVGKNQFMIWMAFLPKGSDWLCPRPAPKPSREQAKARTTTLGIQGPPKNRSEDGSIDGADPDLGIGTIYRQGVNGRTVFSDHATGSSRPEFQIVRPNN